jgi:hypothetical protein
VKVALIEFFAVPPGDDDAFLAAWREERPPEAVVLRAIRTDVAMRFVGISPREGAYQIVHEDGALEGPGGVVFVNPFEVRRDDDERFLTGWHRARDVLGAQRGYLGTRLYRCDVPTEFRFVHIGRWSSPLMVQRAMQRLELTDMAFHPVLYQIVR